MNSHPLKRLWRAFSTIPGQDDEGTVFVEACTLDEAKSQILAILRTVYRAEFRSDWRDDEVYYNVKPFAEMTESGAVRSSLQRVFECGWQGDVPISWVPGPIFAVKPGLATLLADAYGHLPRLPDQTFAPTTFRMLTRPQAIRSLRNGAPHERTDPCGIAWHRQRVSAPLDAMTALFGQGNATLGALSGRHWAVQFEDGLVAHAHNFRGRHGVSGVWDLSCDDPRGAGRLACVIADRVSLHAGGTAQRI